MDARPGGTDRHAPASRMRAGVAGAVRAGVKARGLTPAALASFLTAAAFTPLLVPVVGRAGARMDQVVKLTVFLTDLADLGVFRQVRDSYISPGRPPASSLVQVSGLVNPEFRVEIEALAVT